jgi:hypothetical protein
MTTDAVPVVVLTDVAAAVTKALVHAVVGHYCFNQLLDVSKVGYHV